MLQKIRKWVVEQVLWAEQHLKGKSGAEKREAVVEKVCDMIDVPLVPEFVERPIKRWIVGGIADLAVEKWNWLTDWAFTDVSPTETQIEVVAECLDAPLPKMAAAATAPTLDERLEELCRIYKIAPTSPPAPMTGEGEKQLESVALIPPKDDFERSITFSLKWEGGKNFDANGRLLNKADKGGLTACGITEPTLAYAYASGVVGHKDIRKLTQDEAKKIYRRNFWDRYGWGELTWPVCLCALDCSINHGGFAWILQRACNDLRAGLTVDGKYGPRTRTALIELSIEAPQSLAQAIVERRKEYYDAIVAKDPIQKANLKGWYNRLRDMATTAGVKSPV